MASHRQILKRIADGELVGYEFFIRENHGECLILYFSCEPTEQLIKPESESKYVDALVEFNRSKLKKSLGEMVGFNRDKLTPKL